MKASQAIDLLKTLDPNTDVGPWIRSYKGNFIDTLDFMEAGKAIRIVHPILGKPYSTMNTDSGGKPLRFRDLVWATKDKFDLVLKACTELEKAGINTYKITDMGWFHIHIQRDLYYSSFTSSDNPEEWRRRQDKRYNAAVEREIANEKIKQQQEEAFRAACEARNKQWKKEQEEKKLAEERKAKEAKEEAERRKKEAEAERERIRLALENPTRSVEVKGGD